MGNNLVLNSINIRYLRQIFSYSPHIGETIINNRIVLRDEKIQIQPYGYDQIKKERDIIPLQPKKLWNSVIFRVAAQFEYKAPETSSRPGRFPWLRRRKPPAG